MNRKQNGERTKLRVYVYINERGGREAPSKKTEPQGAACHIDYIIEATECRQRKRQCIKSTLSEI